MLFIGNADDENFMVVVRARCPDLGLVEGILKSVIPGLICWCNLYYFLP